MAASSCVPTALASTEEVAAELASSEGPDPKFDAGSIIAEVGWTAEKGCIGREVLNSLL